MNKLLTIVLVLVICGFPLAFGGVQTISFSIAEGILFLATLLLVAKQTMDGRIDIPIPRWPLILAFWILLQVLPLPVELVRFISPARVIEYPNIAGFANTDKWITLSSYPHQTLLAFLKFLMYLCAFILAAHLYSSRNRSHPAVGALIFVGCAEAVYGLIQYLTGWQKIFTYTKIYDLHEATGTYINRNHFAGLLELTFPFAFAASFYWFQVWLEARRTARSSSVSGETATAAARSLFYLLLLLIGLVAIVFSRSRAGIFASLISLLLAAILGQAKVPRRIWLVSALVFMFFVGGYAIWIGLDPVLARFESMRDPDYVQLEGRVGVWRDAFALARDYVVTGSGFGTFGTIYPRYQTTLVNFSVDHAHNDYLEWASDTGLAGALLLFGPIFSLLISMIGSFITDSRRRRRSITLACIASTLGLLIHSFTDFNLQIPANATLFAVVLGIGYKIVYVERRQETGAGVRTT